MEGSWGCPWGAPKWTKTHKNWPKWTKMVTISWQSKSVLNLSWVTYMIFFLIKWTHENGKESEQVREGSCSHTWGKPKCMCISCVTPWPLHDFSWLLSPFECPFNPEWDHISHSGQIWNTLLCHDMVTILVHFGPFWCTSWAYTPVESQSFGKKYTGQTGIW